MSRDIDSRQEIWTPVMYRLNLNHSENCICIYIAFQTLEHLEKFRLFPKTNGFYDWVELQDTETYFSWEIIDCFTFHKCVNCLQNIYQRRQLSKWSQNIIIISQILMKAMVVSVLLRKLFISHLVSFEHSTSPVMFSIW